jgi:hypothetical protein
MEQLSLLELKVLDFIQENFQCRFLDVFFSTVTKLADSGIFWILLAVIFLFFKKTRKTGLMMGVALLCGLIVGNLTLKPLIGRIRPYDLNPGVSLLIDKGRETYLAAIKESFDELVNEKAGVVLAKVTAAQELTAEEKDALAASLAEFTKQNVNLAVNVDKEIIGGLKVQIGDIVYDGSVVQSLKSIRQHLSN